MREIEESEVPEIIAWLENHGYLVIPTHDEERVPDDSPPFTPVALEEFEARGFVRRNRKVLRVPAEDFLPRRPPRMQNAHVPRGQPE